jgi:5,10-methylenetetrahydrofolate reductase
MGTFAAQLFDPRAFPVALEITPPREPLPHVLERRATLIGRQALAINVIQRADRQSSLEASLALREQGFDPVWHLVQRGRTRDGIEADIARAREAGIRLVHTIRGVHAAGDLPDTPKIREVVAMVRDGLPGAIIGATLNQYQEPGAVLRNLFPKIEAGASYVQTQPVFDPANLAAIMERVRDRAPETRAVAMLMPVLSIEAARRMEQRLGFALPESFTSALERGGEVAGWAHFEETLLALSDSSCADAVAVMTLAIDPDPDFTARMREAIDRVQRSTAE